MSRLKIEIDENELLAMRDDGWSLAELAEWFEVDKKTIKRRLRMLRPPDSARSEFAKKLLALSAEAPSEFCKLELRRMVNDLRVMKEMSAAEKQQLVVKSINSGAREVEEIAEDCRFTLPEAHVVLEEMIAENMIEKRPRGGALNRGRKMKFHYYLVRERIRAAFGQQANFAGA